MRSFYFAKRKNSGRAGVSVKTETRLALKIVPAAAILVALAMSSQTRAQTITIFDAPGAGTGFLQGTYAFNISPSGTIIGNCRDADNVSHGFILDRNGAFTTFDAPDAGHVPGVDDGTYPFGINTKGAITGWYVDDADANHGFVRGKNGAIVEFDVPGAGPGLFVWSINPSGAVTGYFRDANFVVHGFVRTGDPALGVPQSLAQ